MDVLIAAGADACYGIYHTGSGSGSTGVAKEVSNHSDLTDAGAGACYGIYHTGSGSSGSTNAVAMNQAGDSLVDEIVKHDSLSVEAFEGSSLFVLTDWSKDLITGSENNDESIAVWSDGIINAPSCPP